MKILLLNPPNSGRSIPEERYGIDSLRLILRGEPLALEALAGNLGDHDLRLVDLKADPGAWPGALLDFRPDLVGITAVTCEAPAALALAAECREAGVAKVVVGGVHASCDPGYFNDPAVDFIALGLGKLSFRELVDRLEEGRPAADLPGIVPTSPGAPLVPGSRRYTKADLVEERPPRYDLCAPYREQYVLGTLGMQIGLVATAYGCPHRCSFCSIAPMTGGRYLTQDVETTMRDIRLLGDIPLIRLTDANSFGNLRQARLLAEAVLEEGIEKHFLADVRADTVVANPGLLRLWKRAGLRSVVIGFEEILDADLDAMGKGSGASVNAEAIFLLHELGITIVGDFIISPDYDESRFDALERYLERNAVDLPMLTVLTPLPGTPLHERMKENIMIHDLAYYTLTNAVVPTRMNEERFYRRYADLLKASHSGARL